MRKHISSKSNPIFKEIKKLLTSSSFRKKSGYTVAIGQKIVLDILTSNLSQDIKYLAISPNIDASEYEDILGDTPIVILDNQLTKELGPIFHDQNILAVITKHYATVSDIPPTGPYLVLDNVSDPLNVGTLIRTATGLGYKAVLVNTETADPLSPKVIRYSAGYSLFIPIYRAPTKRIFQFLKDKAMKIITTYLDNHSCMPTFTKALEEFALCLGNEGQGLSPIWREYPDSINLSLKMEQIDSFNVAVAGSILMYILKTGGELCG